MMRNAMQKQNTNREQYLPETLVSEITGMSVATLRNHRWLGKGIPYIKIGRTVRYQESEILAYLDKLKVQTKPL